MAFRQYHFKDEQGNSLQRWTARSACLYAGELIDIEGKTYRIKEITWDMLNKNIAVVKEEKELTYFL